MILYEYSKALSGIYMEKQPPRRADISVRDISRALFGFGCTISLTYGALTAPCKIWMAVRLLNSPHIELANNIWYRFLY